MVGDVEGLQPELSDLSQDATFVWNGRGNHPVERTNSIRGNQQVAVTQIVDISDFALADQ